ncbi:MAG: hypothetical protein GQ582_13760 [Methyloprofundus sp.]|nr:hypothetical protein [Methyloprofundus sp.]
MTAFGSVWLIAIAWCFLQGSVSLANLFLGGILGMMVLTFSLAFNGMRSSFIQLKAMLQLVFFVLIELVSSSFRITWDILTPTDYARPRIVRVPVDDLNEIAITVLANAISLTPGSLALEVSDDCQNLYVHVMYAEDRDTTVASMYFDLGNKVRAACGIEEIAP